MVTIYRSYCYMYTYFHSIWGKNTEMQIKANKIQLHNLHAYKALKLGPPPQKKMLCCPHPTKIWKLGRSVGIFFFFFFFFLRTVRELSFPIFFFKFLNGENSGGMQSKRIYKSCKCFFKPLNTNFSKFFAQIWHLKKKKKKKNDPVFSHFTVGRERAT